MRYQAPLDGIRAIAILAVFVVHVWPGALQGGFVGVDVFFVLSGYLITSIILHDYQSGHFSFRVFYLRRALRLIPNAALSVLTSVLLWLIFQPPSAARQTASHGLWALFNISNFFVWKRLGGYWGGAAAAAPLTHTWSLGVEEQFYVFFPAVLLSFAKIVPRYLNLLLGGVAFVSLLLCGFATYSHPEASFYLLPSRLWELMAGALLASTGAGSWKASFTLSRSTNEWFGWLGLGVVLVTFFSLKEGNAFPGWQALLPVGGTMAIIMSVRDEGTLLARLLATQPFVLVGKMSYSLYLWHWPLITLGKAQAECRDWPIWTGAAVGALVSVLLAIVAYRLVELPLRQRGEGQIRRVLCGSGILGLAAMVSLIVASRDIVADPQQYFDRPSFSVRAYDTGLEPGTSWPETLPFFDLAAANRGADLSTEPWRQGGIQHRYDGAPPRVVVFGSSHALMYCRLIDDICRQHRISICFLGAGQGTPVFYPTPVSGNFPTVQDARDYDDMRRKSVREYRPDVLLAIDRWELRAKSSSEFQLLLREFMAETAPHVRHVVFVAQVPVLGASRLYNLREYVCWRMSDGETPPRILADEANSKRLELHQTAEAECAAFPNLQVLRPDRAFTNADGSVRYMGGRKFFYANHDHLTDAGAEQVRDIFEFAILQACRRE